MIESVQLAREWQERTTAFMATSNDLIGESAAGYRSRFSRQRQRSGQKPAWLPTARILVLIVALGIIVLGLVISCIGFASILFAAEADLLSMVTLLVSLLALTVGLGLALAWHAWRAEQGRASAVFQPRRVGLWLLLYVIVVALGQVILAAGVLPLIAFPPFHVAAAALPPFIILALVARKLGGISSWRDLTLQVCSGAFVSSIVAFVLEGLLLLGILAITLLGVAVRPEGRELLQALASSLEDPSRLQDPALLAPAVASPAILVLAIALFAGLVPLIEEAVKTVGVGLRAYARPTLAQCFLWGLGGGAGFALVEGLLNTVGGLETWAPVIVLRAGATVLHCTTGALMGLAWYNALLRRWKVVLGLYAASAAIHGLWNAVSGGMTYFSLRTISAESTNTDSLLAGLGVFGLLPVLVLLAVAMAALLTGLTSYVRRVSNPMTVEAHGQGQPIGPGRACSGTPKEPPSALRKDEEHVDG